MAYEEIGVLDLLSILFDRCSSRHFIVSIKDINTFRDILFQENFTVNFGLHDFETIMHYFPNNIKIVNNFIIIDIDDELKETLYSQVENKKHFKELFQL